MTFFWSIGVLKISECRLRISDFECAICLILQSAIRNLKSAINFTPSLHHSMGKTELNLLCSYHARITDSIVQGALLVIKAGHNVTNSQSKYIDVFCKMPAN